MIHEIFDGCRRSEGHEPCELDLACLHFHCERSKMRLLWQHYSHFIKLLKLHLRVFRSFDSVSPMRQKKEILVKESWRLRVRFCCDLSSTESITARCPLLPSFHVKTLSRIPPISQRKRREYWSMAQSHQQVFILGCSSEMKERATLVNRVAVKNWNNWC